MSVKLQPLADYVVAQTEEPATKTASGLFLPDKSAEKPQVAKVLAVGTAVKGLKVGDRVVHKSYSSTDVKLDGKDYVIIKEEDILAIVK